MNENNKCWEQFLIPTIRSGSKEMEILDFECPITHHAFSIYYSKSERINAEIFSKVMNSTLSSCFHCIQSKLDCHSEDSE